MKGKNILKQRLANYLLAPYWKRKIYRQAIVCHPLIPGSNRYGYFFVSFSPILGNALGKTVDPLGHYEEFAIPALLYHFPNIFSPDIRILQKEIRGEAGIKTVPEGYLYSPYLFLETGIPKEESFFFTSPALRSAFRRTPIRAFTYIL